MAARMSSEAEAAALLEATTTTVATAAAALEAEAAKPDELQLEIEAARAKARAAQDGADAPPPRRLRRRAGARTSERKAPSDGGRAIVSRTAPPRSRSSRTTRRRASPRSVFRKYMAATNAAGVHPVGRYESGPEVRHRAGLGHGDRSGPSTGSGEEGQAGARRARLRAEHPRKLRSQVPPPTKDDEAIARFAAQLAEEEEPEPEGPKEPADWRTSGPLRRASGSRGRFSTVRAKSRRSASAR